MRIHLITVMAGGLVGAPRAPPSEDSNCKEVARRAGLEENQVVCRSGRCVGIMRRPSAGRWVDIDSADAIMDFEEAFEVSCNEAAQWIANNQRIKRRREQRSNQEENEQQQPRLRSGEVLRVEQPSVAGEVSFTEAIVAEPIQDDAVPALGENGEENTEDAETEPEDNGDMEMVGSTLTRHEEMPRIFPPESYSTPNDPHEQIRTDLSGVPQMVLPGSDSEGSDDEGKEDDAAHRHLADLLGGTGRVLRQSLMPLALAFPFVSVEDVTSAEQKFSLAGDLLMHATSEHYELLAGVYTSHPRLLQTPVDSFQNALGMMMATLVNDPGHEQEHHIKFLGLSLSLLEGIFAAVQTETTMDGIFGAQNIMLFNAKLVEAGFTPIPVPETPAVSYTAVFAKATQKSHNALVCSVCNALGSDKARPVDIVSFGDKLSEEMKLLSDPERVKSGDAAFRAKYLAQHWMHGLETLEFGFQAQHTEASSFNAFLPENIEKVCTIHTPHIFSSVGLTIADPRASEKSIPNLAKLRRTLLELAHMCTGALDRDVVARIVPKLLRRSVLYLPVDAAPPRIAIDQQLDPVKRLESIFTQMEGVTKVQLMHDGHTMLQVSYKDSRSIGVGTIKNMISIVAAAVVDKSVNMFTITGEGSPTMNPKASSTSEAYLKKFRTLGQTMGIAHALEMVMGLPLSDSVLYLMHLIRGGLIELEDIMRFVTSSEDNIENLLANFESDKPGKFATLAHGDLSKLVGVIEFDLQPGKFVENHSDSERRAYLVDQALVDTIVEIYPHVRAMVAGFYDVAPFPLLSYFDMTHMTNIFTARNLVIDRTDLKRSTTYMKKSTVEEQAKSVTEEELQEDQTIQWFWDIIENVLTEEQLGDFLLFVSASRYPPLGGFTGVNRDKEWLQINYIATGVDYLLTARTCFQALTLSKYSSREMLLSRIFEANSYEVMDGQQ